MMPERELIHRAPRLRFRRRRTPVPTHIGFPWGDEGGGPPPAGVREPRRPAPTTGAGAMALPLERD
jgi:hypothetical protein